MKKFKNIVLLTLVAVVFSGCTTQTTSSNPIDKAEEECISGTSSTYKMNRCSQIAQKKWEQEIQNSLDTLKKNLTEDDYAVIEKSQQAWNEYKIAEYERNLRKYAMAKLIKIPHLDIVNIEADGGIIAFNVKDVFSQDVAYYLNKYQICVRWLPES